MGRARASTMRSAAAILLFSCGDVGIAEFEYGPEPQGTPAAERIHIDDDRSSLSRRVEVVARPVLLQEDALTASARELSDGIGSTGRGLSSERTYQLTHVATIAPPVVAGEYPDSTPAGEFLLQATSVDVGDDTVVVSYHQRGQVFSGAIDVIDISDPGQPAITSSAHFDHLDINSVRYDSASGLVYAASTTCDPQYLVEGASALVERMRVTNGRIDIASDRRTRLLGVSGQAVMSSPSLFFGVGGENGGLIAYDASERRIFQADLGDARWLDAEEGLLAVVSGGSEGRLHTFSFDDRSVAALDSHRFEGADVRFSRSTVLLAGQKAFIAAGPAGLQVLSARDGTLVGRLPLPSDSGYAPEDVVTNAMTLAGDIAFLANGGLGLHLVELDRDPRLTGPSDRVEMRVVGRLDFSGSANHVLYRGGHLFVASGADGLQIIRVDVL